MTRLAPLALLLLACGPRAARPAPPLATHAPRPPHQAVPTGLVRAYTCTLAQDGVAAAPAPCAIAVRDDVLILEFAGADALTGHLSPRGTGFHLDGTLRRGGAPAAAQADGFRLGDRLEVSYVAASGAVGTLTLVPSPAKDPASPSPNPPVQNLIR